MHTHMKTAVILACLAVLSAPLYAASAIDILKKAHKGDVVAMRQIGYMQFQGKGTKMDRKNGLAWLKRAAERGDTQAMYYLGCIYDQGIYVGQDKVEAEAYLSKAAKRGHNKAAKKLAELKGTDSGKSNESSDSKIAENKKKAPVVDETDIPDARVARKDEKRRAPVGRNSQAEQYYEAGCNYEQEGNNELAIENYLKAAKLGHAESIYIVGRFWFYDVGDIEKGINALADAGKKGHAKANFALGQICSAKCIPVGLLMEDEEFGYALIMNESNLSEKYHDMDRAITFLRDAAKSGEARAQALLGLFYEKGKGVTKDVEQAKGWYKKAASQGYEYAAEALKELEAAAEPKDETPEIPDARVARKDEKSQGPDDQNTDVKKKARLSEVEERAENEYRKGLAWVVNGANKYKAGMAEMNFYWAAIRGHVKAQYMYAICKSITMGVNNPESSENLKKAAEKGHVGAMVSLALSYKEGMGVPTNDRRTKEWAVKAYKKGASLSAELMERVADDQSLPPELVKCINQVHAGNTLPGNREPMLQKLAADDDMWALYLLSKVEKNKGTENEEQYLLKAAELGHVVAQCDLAGLYLSKDQEKSAIKWLHKADQMGWPPAAGQLWNLDALDEDDN